MFQESFTLRCNKCGSHLVDIDLKDSEIDTIFILRCLDCGNEEMV